jgi:DNA-binding CsgD family transcriptional regulator
MRPVSLPAGLMDENLEIFIHQDNLFVLYKGRPMPFEMLHEDIHDTFLQHMLANKKALESLKTDFGYTDVKAMLVQYVKCNFGNFDNIPDADVNGTIYPECWDCGKRGTCPAEGKVCGRIVGPHGILERAETEIFFLLIAGNSHKMIADMRGKHIQTIESQLKSIREKLGCHSSIEVMDFAMKRKLI